MCAGAARQQKMTKYPVDIPALRLPRVMSMLTVLRSGERVLIRPICKEDQHVLLEGLHRLSPESK